MMEHATTTKKKKFEHFRKNAVRGIKMLMRNGITISAMTPNDWKYLRSMTNNNGPVDGEASERLQLDDENSETLVKESDCNFIKALKQTKQFFCFYPV